MLNKCCVWFAVIIGAGVSFGAGRAAAQSVTKFADEYAAMLSTATGTLYGSLVMPTGDSVSTVVLLIAGSGPTDRDGNQAFIRCNNLKMLALSLAENNVASLRFDKRGIGASREAGFAEDKVTMQTYVDDVKGWINHLRRDGRFRKIVVMGHSEGALLGTVAMAQGARANALVSLSGIGRTMDQVLKDQLSGQAPQIRDIAYGIIDSLKAGHTVKQVPFYLNPVFRSSIQPFMRSSMELNPQAQIRKISVPILIIQGDTDIQVRVEDARLLHAANPNSRLEVIAGMNHVLKDCPTINRNIQMSTYSNPALPLNTTMVREIVDFVGDLN